MQRKTMLKNKMNVLMITQTKDIKMQCHFTMQVAFLCHYLSILHYMYFAIPHFFTLFTDVLTDNAELQLSTYAAQTIFLHKPLLK